jgi:DegV family protein with EDD domain
MTKDKVYLGIISGAREVMQHKSQLNQINVFPVADGDTGSNLYSTMKSIINKSEKKESLKSTMASVADAALEGARGNSGIIFAQFFQGISDGIKGDEFTSDELIFASDVAVQYAYEAVEQPVEGTILTIMKVFSDSLKEYCKDGLITGLESAYEKVIKAVDHTTEQLKVLKKSSVVDSGAKGFQVFLKGFILGLKGQYVLHEEEEVDFIEHIHDDTFNYRYCTEALVKDCSEDLKLLLEDLGDSLIVAGSKRKKRIHIHTDQPKLVFNRLSKLSIILEQKVDDMQRQHAMVHHRKHNRVIVTDSIADLPQAIVDDEQVYVLPLNLLIGEENYLDKLTISNERVLDLAHLKPTSSLPSEKEVSNMINYLQSYYDEIFILSVSSHLSGTFQLLKKYADQSDNVHVLDTLQNSVAQGVLVNQAIDYLNKEIKTSQFLGEIKKDIDHSRILVSVDSIDPMVASGRLSVNAGHIVKKVGIKPIVTLNNGQGAIAGIGMSRKQAISKLVKKVHKLHKSNNLKRLAIAYVDDKDKAEELKKTFDDLKIPVDYLVQTSSIIANGAGRGALAIGYITER